MSYPTELLLRGHPVDVAEAVTRQDRFIGVARQLLGDVHNRRRLLSLHFCSYPDFLLWKAIRAEEDFSLSVSVFCTGSEREKSLHFPPNDASPKAVGVVSASASAPASAPASAMASATASASSGLAFPSHFVII